MQEQQPDCLSNLESSIIIGTTVGCLFQFFKIITMQWCDGHNRENFISVIKISEYKDWFKSQGENQTEITDCIEGGLKYAMQLAVCCGNISQEILGSTYYLFCSGKAEDVFCKLIDKAIKSGTDANFFSVIGKSKICNGSCPFNLEKHRARRLRSTDFQFNRLKKRQFDLASTFDAIEQFICSDMEKSSSNDAWNPIIVSHHLAKENDDIDYNEFLYMFVFRMPACCLLDRRSRA